MVIYYFIIITELANNEQIEKKTADTVDISYINKDTGGRLQRYFGFKLYKN